MKAFLNSSFPENRNRISSALCATGSSLNVMHRKKKKQENYSKLQILGDSTFYFAVALMNET